MTIVFTYLRKIRRTLKNENCILVRSLGVLLQEHCFPARLHPFVQIYTFFMHHYTRFHEFMMAFNLLSRENVQRQGANITRDVCHLRIPVCTHRYTPCLHCLESVEFSFICTLILRKAVQVRSQQTQSAIVS